MDEALPNPLALVAIFMVIDRFSPLNGKLLIVVLSVYLLYNFECTRRLSLFSIPWNHFSDKNIISSAS